MHCRRRPVCRTGRALIDGSAFTHRHVSARQQAGSDVGCACEPPPPAFVWTTSTTAHAAGETRDGKPATMVVADAPPTPSTPVMGTVGDDVIVVTYADYVIVDGGAGNDTICGGPITSVQGGDGNDDLWAGAPTSGTDTLDGDDGDDVLHGDAARDYLHGGNGDDTIYGGGGNDIITGGLVGAEPATPDDDTIDAGPGNDSVGDDWGNDTLVGGPGRDTLVLGDGATFPYDDCPPTDMYITATLDARAGTVTGIGDDTISGFRVYLAGRGDNTLLGSDGSDWLEAGSCATATIDGRGGNDHIFQGALGSVSGGSGDDHIWIDAVDPVRAGPGNDRVEVHSRAVNLIRGAQLYGGSGRDRLVDKSGRLDRIDLRHGLSVDGGVRVPAQSFENAMERHPHAGSAGGPFVLIGTSGRNLLQVTASTTSSPPAIIRGLAGNDTLLGRHRDTAYGGTGRDLCRAGHELSCERS
jgi:Ca2+-binding RTX toxin-like protein